MEEKSGEMTPPRVNSAMLPKYRGRMVRMTCKIIKLQGESAIVQASDGGQVIVKLLNTSHVTDQYVDIIGKVDDETTLKMLQVKNWGSSIDMEIVNKTVEELHRLTDWMS